MAENGGIISRLVRRGIKGSAEACFPTNDFGAPDWQQAEVVDRTVAYIDLLSGRPRLLLLFLYSFIEIASPILLAGLLPFSMLSVAARQRAMTRWANSPFVLYNYLYDGLMAQQKMMYLSHPSVQRHLEVWKTCTRELDPYGTPLREGALAGDTADGLAEVAR